MLDIVVDDAVFESVPRRSYRRSRTRREILCPDDV